MALSIRQHAVIAGIALVVMALAAGFSFGYVQSELIVAGDSATTYAQLQAQPGLFKASNASWLLVLLLDVVVAWALYHFFKPSHQPLSLITAILRLIYTVIFGVGIWHLLVISPLLDGSPTDSILLLPSQVMDHFDAFERIWGRGLILFGVHLLGLGVLAWRANFVPQLWGALLLLAGVSYMAVHLGYLLLPDFAPQVTMLEQWLMIPMMVGELGFAGWLIIRGGRHLSTQAA